MSSEAFQTFYPEMHQSYQANREALLMNNPSLKFPLKNSIFAAITINFGPSTVTYIHRDYKNRAAGICAVRACGNFDDEKGGHIILWDLGLIIRFPAGSTIFLPSALIRHSNTTIRATETRYSITQYSSGHLFRYVDNGCCSDEVALLAADRWESTLRELIQENRWDDMLKQFHIWHFNY